MLIIPSLLFALSFLTKIAVLAAPIPLNDIYFNAHASLKGDALFSRADRKRTTSNTSAPKPAKPAPKPAPPVPEPVQPAQEPAPEPGPSHSNNNPSSQVEDSGSITHDNGNGRTTPTPDPNLAAVGGSTSHQNTNISDPRFEPPPGFQRRPTLSLRFIPGFHNFRKLHNHPDSPGIPFPARDRHATPVPPLPPRRSESDQ